MARNDIHSPANMVPADYTHVCDYSVPDRYYMDRNALLVKAMRTGEPQQLKQYRWEHGQPVVTNVETITAPKAPFFAHPGGNGGLGTCDHCGNTTHLFGSCWRHEPTGEHILVGWQCSDNMGFAADYANRKRLKAARKAAIEQQRKAERLAATLAENPGLEEAFKVDHRIIQDIAGRFARYGSISPKQVWLVLKLAREQQQRAEDRANRKYADAPEGRVTVEGKVVKLAEKQTRYGSSLKMTVVCQADNGAEYLVWGTVPGNLLRYDSTGERGPIERGDKVRFTATLTRSDRDRHFAFAKRPTGAEILTPRPSQATA